MERFLLNFLKRAFNCLQKITLFSIIKHIISGTSETFLRQGDLEFWSLFNLAISVVFLWIYSIYNNQCLGNIFLGYAIWRIFEILVFTINYCLLSAQIIPVKHTLILSLINITEIIFWFSIFYQRFFYLFKSEFVCLNSFIASIYFSVVTMTTLGYGDIIPIKDISRIAIIIQSLIGIFFAIIIISSLVSAIKK